MLLRLYSETDLLLKEVQFHEGINLILGRYSEDRKNSLGVNGIGKSSVVRLVAFCLLSDETAALFRQEKYAFLRKEDHTVSLAFKVDDKVLTIKRSFRTEDVVWLAEENGNFNQYTRGEVKSILLQKMFPVDSREVFFEGNRYGTLMRFFIKDDLSYQERKDPLNFFGYEANQRVEAIYNYFLLGLPTKGVIDLDAYLEASTKQRKLLDSLENKVKAETGKSPEELKSDRIRLQESIGKLKESLQSYKFLPAYQELEDQLVRLTAEVNEALRKHHTATVKLKRIQAAYEMNQPFDTVRVQKIYNEALEAFGDVVQAKLEDVLKFREDVIQNRNRFLREKEKQVQAEVAVHLEDIARIEEHRSRLYKLLEEKGALDSIKNTYERVVTERADLERKSQALQHIDAVQEKIEDLDVSITLAKKETLAALRNNDEKVAKLRSLFQDILTNAILMGEETESGYFDIKILTSSRKNQLPFQIKVEIPKADALGQARLKIVAYDLLVFFNSIRERRRLPRFLVHDGAYHSCSKKLLIDTLNYIHKEYIGDPRFQYIAAFNEDEIEIPDDKRQLYGTFAFDLSKATVAEYEDVPEKMLFKRAFV